MQEKKIFDVVIIGGGPVGLATIFSSCLEGLFCAVIDANSVLGGQCITKYSDKYIYDIPGCLKIQSKELISQLVKQVNQFEPKIILNEVVNEINKHSNVFEINTQSGKILKSKLIVVALGGGLFSPIKLEIKNPTDLLRANVIYDFKDLGKYKDKIIVVLGGGDTALDYVLQLSKNAKKVYLIHRRLVFKGNIFVLESLKKQKNVEILTDMFLLDLKEQNQQIQLFFDNQNSIVCDYIFPCYGVVSSLGFLERWQLATRHNKILVDSSFETSVKGVFAIGDCIFRENRRNLLITGFSEAMELGLILKNFIYNK